LVKQTHNFSPSSVTKTAQNTKLTAAKTNTSSHTQSKKVQATGGQDGAKQTACTSELGLCNRGWQDEFQQCFREFRPQNLPEKL